MKTLKNIAYKLLAITLLVAVLLPSAIKLEHVFEDHEHEICSDISTQHLHEIDLECEFYKFKLNTEYQIVFNHCKILVEENYFKKDCTPYFFLNNHQQLPFSLRGPPILV